MLFLYCVYNECNVCDCSCMCAHVSESGVLNTRQIVVHAYVEREFCMIQFTVSYFFG